MKEILWPRILNPTNVSFSFNPQKLVPTKIKPSTVSDKEVTALVSGLTQQVKDPLAAHGIGAGQQLCPVTI